MRKIEPLVCVKRRYEFSDGSVVLWTPADESQKAHGLFRVDICIKIHGLPRVSWSHRSGPPSESASLHWLKWAKKDARKNGSLYLWKEKTRLQPGLIRWIPSELKIQNLFGMEKYWNLFCKWCRKLFKWNGRSNLKRKLTDKEIYSGRICVINIRFSSTE